MTEKQKARKPESQKTKKAIRIERKKVEKPAALSSYLVALKGKAAASGEAKGRGPEDASAGSGTATLNFKISSEFRQRFTQRAAEADLKLNELLRQALDAWEEKNLVKP